jgi:hypothetical protein
VFLSSVGGVGKPTKVKTDVLFGSSLDSVFLAPTFKMSAAAAAASEKAETVTVVFGKEFDGESIFGETAGDEADGEGAEGAEGGAAVPSKPAVVDDSPPFARVPVTGNKKAGTSLLSTALASVPAAAATRGNVAAANVKLSLQVSVKGADGSTSFIGVTVSRRATIEDVIGSVLAAPTNNIVFTNTDPSAYTLMIADADGEPDEDFAVALGADQPVLKFKSKYFALAKKERTEEAADQTKNKFVEAPQYETTDAIKDFRVLKVHMPDASYMHLPYPAETTPLNTLLITICEKRSLPATEYTLFDGGSQSELDMDRPVGAGLGIIRLVRKPDAAGIALQATSSPPSGSSSPALSRTRGSIRSPKGDGKGSTNSVQRNASGPLFFLTPAVAAQYKTFPVVKVNKYGVKQFRIMGIDASSITNFKSALDAEDPDAQASEDDSGGGSLRRDARGAKSFLSMRSLRRSTSATSKGEANTKRPSRPIEDILEVAYDFSRKANAFSIRYKDKEIHYESKLADEIVAKIEMLLQMRKNPTISVV